MTMRSGRPALMKTWWLPLIRASTNPSFVSPWRVRSRRPASKRQFEHPTFLLGHRGRLTCLEPEFHGLKKIGANFLFRLTLGDAARKRGNLRPETALFCFMNYGFECYGANLMSEAVRGKRGGASRTILTLQAELPRNVPTLGEPFLQVAGMKKVTGGG